MRARHFVVSSVMGMFALAIASQTARAAAPDAASAVPQAPPVNITATAGSGPTATIAVHLPAGSNQSGGAQGSSSQSGAASGAANGSVLSDPSQNSCVSCTNANSAGGSSAAGADGLSILGQSVAGGSSSGSGSDQNAIVAADLGPIASAFIAPWMTSSNSSVSNGSSTAQADLATVQLGDQLATVAVLNGTSTASSQQDSSSSSGSGSSSTDLASTNALQGKVVLILVHSDSSSGNGAHAYLASINGHQVGASSGGGTPVTIPGAGTIVLVPTSSSGGQSSAGGANGDATAGSQRQSFRAGGASASGGTGAGTDANASSGANPANASSPTGSNEGINATAPSVPVTGVVIAASALLLVGAGFVLTSAGILRLRPRARR